QWMAPLPVVLNRLQRRTATGAPEPIRYRLAMSEDPDPDDIVVCTADDVRTGQWAPTLDVTLSPSRSIVDAAATAIFDTAKQHAELLPLEPRFKNDRLTMPPAGAGPAGYGELANVSEDEARTLWTEVAEIAGRSPRLALTIGVPLA